MKRPLALGAAVAVLGIAAFAGSASTADAASGIATPYGPVTYPMGAGSDFWTCSGVRLTAGTAVQDHFTCTVSEQTFVGTFTESNRWPCGCSGWWSDYDGREATSYIIRVSSNGKVVGTATY
jgi:hypothetical protein